ncbi:MAG: DNA repair protein RecO, partial [Dehalococcoidia bacterium]
MSPNTRLYKTEAIVLRQRRVGEADRFLTIYTPGLGKFDVKAKGVRKTTSRMSGHLQPLAHCMLQIAQGHSMDVVTGVETLASFGHLREDLDRLSLALYAAELTDRITPERATSFPSFRLLLDALQRLDREADGWAALRYFEMQLLGQAGFRPAIEA